MPLDGSFRQALLLLSRAGFDLGPRGVRALDVETGETLWSYFVGPKPEPLDTHLVDLDADGSPEIIFGGSAVGNIHEGAFHGTRDDTSRVFVVDASGNLRWSRAFNSYPARVFVRVADLRGDSLPEIIVGTKSPDWEGNGLFLLDGAGTPLDTLMVPAGVRKVGVLPHESGSRSVLIQTADFTLLRILTAPKLAVAARVKLNNFMALGGTADLTPEPGPEILMGGNAHLPTWLFSADLKPLAYLPAGGLPLGPSGLGFFRLGPDTAITFVQGWKYASGSAAPWAFSVERNPRRVPWGWLGVVVVGGASLPVALRLRKKLRPSAVTCRELRLQLLDRLKLSGHGAIGGLSALRRLVWNLKALAQGFAMTGEREQVLRELMADIKETQLPRLEGALELARLVNVEGDTCHKADMALTDLGSRLEKLSKQDRLEGLGGKDVLGLGQAGEVAEAAFQNLRAAVEREFRVDAVRIVTGSLTAHAEALEQAAITVEVDLEGLPACCMDQEELAFVIDNLIENAVRAMRDGQDNRLRIHWARSGNCVTIFFQDSGYGIIPEDWQRIFEAGQSGREDGGLGLPHSREILRKFGGGIMVQESRPGGGTVMALTLAVSGN